MDLGAYAQIEDLSKIAKDNGIDVPRLRGYRLMSNEEPVKIEYSDGLEVFCAEDLITTIPSWDTKATMWEFSSYKDVLKDYYLIRSRDKNEYGYYDYVAVNWSRIHGKKRKALKTAIHNQKRKIREQMETFNKYAGRTDVLYIHSRIGGNNWSSYYQYVVGQPWFIEKVDDYFDSTYCDIYARIKPVLQTGVSV